MTTMKPTDEFWKLFDAAHLAIFQNAKVYGMDSLSGYHEEEEVDQDTPVNAVFEYVDAQRERIAELEALLLEREDKEITTFESELAKLGPHIVARVGADTLLVTHKGWERNEREHANRLALVTEQRDFALAELQRVADECGAPEPLCAAQHVRLQMATLDAALEELQQLRATTGFLQGKAHQGLLTIGQVLLDRAAAIRTATAALEDISRQCPERSFLEPLGAIARRALEAIEPVEL